MLFSTWLPVTLAVLANQAAAEPPREPYKLETARMSVRDLFGVQRREDGAYNPAQQFCGTGDTCPEACGDGFQRCPSRDGFVHCFHADANQTCCFNQSGEACDEDFYCAADDNSATWCCPNELGLEDCASKFNLPALSTPTPSPTSTSTKPTSTAVKLTSGVETASTTAEATLSTTTGPDQPIVTESTGKSSLVHVETSSTLSSSGSDIPCVTSVVESTDMRATSTMTRADSAPDATCTVYTTALALAPAPTVSSVTTSGSDANSATISPGSPDPLSNNVMISAASGHSGVVRGTTMLLGAVAITGALLF